MAAEVSPVLLTAGPCQLVTLSRAAAVRPELEGAEAWVHGDGAYAVGLDLPFVNGADHGVMLTHLFLEPEVPPDRLEQLQVYTSVRAMTAPADLAPYVRARLLEPAAESVYRVEVRFQPRAAAGRPAVLRRGAREAYAILQSLRRLRLNLHWQVIDRRTHRWSWCAVDAQLAPPPPRPVKTGPLRAAAP